MRGPEHEAQLTSNYRQRQRATRITLLYAAWLDTPDHTAARGRALGSGDFLAAFLGSILRCSDLTLGTVANYGLDVARFAEFMEMRTLTIDNVQPSDVSIRLAVSSDCWGAP